MSALAGRRTSAGSIKQDKAQENITQFLSHAKGGNIAGVKKALKNVGVDATDAQGNTALHYASQAGFMKVVKVLLDAKAAPDLKNNDQYSPLHLAARHGHVKVMQALIEKDVDTKAFAKEGFNALCMAILQGHEAVVDTLLKQKGVEVDCVSMSGGFTSLELAAERQSLGVLKVLLAAGADFKGNVHNVDRNPLAIASGMGKVPFVEELLPHVVNSGEDVDKLSIISSALALSAREGHEKVVAVLLKGASDANITDIRALTDRALRYATHKSQILCVEMLLDAGAKRDTSATGVAAAQAQSQDAVNMAFLDAAGEGNMVMVEKLLSRGVNVNMTDERHMTALIRTIMRGNHLDMVTKLLEAGALPNVQMPDGHTALHFAAEKSYVRITQRLLKAGADPTLTIELEGKEGKGGLTPLHYACVHGKAAVVELLVKHPGIDINVQTKEGCTPLFFAAGNKHSSVEVISVLLEAGAKVGNIHTICHCASAEAFDKLFPLVEDYKVGEPDAEGKTALASAIVGRNVHIVEKLYDLGETMCGEKEKSPLVLSALLGSVDLVKFFMSKADASAGSTEDIDQLLAQIILNGKDDIANALISEGWCGSFKAVGGFKEDQKVSTLSAACVKGKVQFVRSLLGAASLRSDLNIAEIAAAPLGYACVEGHADCVEALLEAGADPNVVPAEAAPHPLLMAIRGGHLDIVKLLLKRGANAMYEDRLGRTPLSYAVLCKANTEAIIMELVKAGADILRPNQFGLQPVVEVMTSKNNEAIHAFQKVLELKIASEDGSI